MPLRMCTRLLPTLALIAILAVPALPLDTARAQESPVTISVAIPAFRQDIDLDRLVGDFETAHPGIKLHIVTGSAVIAASPGANLDAYFEIMNQLVSAADVVYVEDQTLSPVATQAGYFLDLAPLVAGDPAFDPADFYPAAWQSFQWDRGLWALPVSAEAILLSYDPAAFDQAGLAYPNEAWTLDDFVHAVRTLTLKDAEGKVTQQALDALGLGSGQSALFWSLLGEGLYDASTLPNTPRFVTPAAEELLETWQALTEEGLLGGQSTDSSAMSIGSQRFTRMRQLPNRQYRSTLLPGGRAGLQVQGFAVSMGTRYPEQAYALAKFLTGRAEFATMFGGTPTRKTLEGERANLGILGMQGLEAQELVGEALHNGIPPSELRFVSYLTRALQKMSQEHLDARTALQAVEAEVVQALQAAAEKRASNVINVATPPPPLELAAGEVALKFGLQTPFVGSQLPNQEQWDRLIRDFVASDPQVGAVQIESGFGSLAETAAQFDCFIRTDNAVPEADLSLLLNLDPFMAADPTFDRADIVGDALTQLQRENKTWAMPLSLTPTVLRYNVEWFARAGVPGPNGTWTMDAFIDALRQLKAVLEADQAPFEAIATTNTHLLMLIAANGAVPLDYRTNPPTIDFTSPASVEAIRTVLDLARQGYIRYEGLASLSRVGVFRISADIPIQVEGLGGFNSRGVGRMGRQGAGSSSSDLTRVVTFPTGTQYNAVSYSIEAGYISANAQNPEACYRLLKTIASTPELISAMPARYSQISSPALASSQGPDVIAMYQELARMLQAPNTISIASFGLGQATGPSSFLLQYWLNKAFDAYVLEDGDLETALADAEAATKAYLDCAANIPPIDSSVDAQAREASARQLLECAVKVDPDLSGFFR